MISPAQIKSELDRYVVGQDSAKRTLATAVALHYRRVAYRGEVHVGKSNLLLLGPTGSGKTFMVQTVARLLEVPFAAITATSITPAGWFGEKAESVVAALLTNAKHRFGKDSAFKRAMSGIAYIDEIDKLAAAQVQRGGEEAFNTIQVQQALLRVIEGTFVTLDGNPFPTDAILFIGSGAFIGMESFVTRREGSPKRAPRDPHAIRRVQPRDFIEYGFLPEFIGRFPVTAALDPLTDVEVLRILRDIKDSLVEQWNALLSVDGCSIEIAEPVLYRIVRNAIAQGTGARGLRSAMEKLIEPAVQDLVPGTIVRIGANGIDYSRPVASSGDLSPPRDRSSLALASGESTPERLPDVS